MDTVPNDGPYAWIGRFTPAPALAAEEPWIDRLTVDPADAVDSLMRGGAHLPGLARASACEALMALMGDLPDDAPEWRLLDGALLDWLKERRHADDPLIARHGGRQHFIREVGEGFRAAWRLELPETSAWIRAKLLDLLRWADTFTVDATFDLGRAVLAAGAHLQQGNELRFLWFRICTEAANARLRHRLDIATLGLTRATITATGGPRLDDAIVGLALWASHLPPQDRHKGDVVREWRALKAAFPHQPAFWRTRLQNILDDDRFAGHPFTDWLKHTDPALKTPPRGTTPRREPLIPRDIPSLIKEMDRDFARDGLTDPLWRRMKLLLDQLDHYADVTGQSYYLVTSCTNIASTVLPAAPGHALTLARRALLWSPSNGHAWSVRAQALEALGRPDLAAAVLWEGRRRVPSDPVFSNQLGRLLAERKVSAADGLLRKAAVLDPNYGPKRLELTRPRSAGREEERQNFLVPQDQTLTDAPVPWDSAAAESALVAEEGEAPRLARIGAASEADLLFGLGNAEHRRALELVDRVIATDRYDAYAQLVKGLGDGAYREELRRLAAGRFDGSLPVRLAALPDDAPAAAWERLAAQFPDGRPLIDLVRLSRGTAGDEERDRLAAWTTLPDRWDDGWTTFLKQEIRAHLNGGGRLPLTTLEHDALTQAVDVGWDAAPLAA